MPEAAIEVSELKKAYPGVKALDAVSFTVARGEVFAYLGRNGAGKTTTLRILATLSRQSSGSVRIAGKRFPQNAHEIRRLIGVSMQHTALDELMTGREHLELVSRLAGLTPRQTRHRVAQLLEMLSLTESADVLIGAYSGGMRRRLDVALSLVHRPPILLMDEPTTGLDPQSRRALWALVEQLKDEGVTILLTTQYIEEADHLADRAGILEGGRLIALATPQELKATVGGAVVHVEADPVSLESVRSRCRAQGMETHDLAGVLRVELPGREYDMTRLLAEFRTLNGPVRRISVAEPTLEDAFIQLTGDQITGEVNDEDIAGLTAGRRLKLSVGRS